MTRSPSSTAFQTGASDMESAASRRQFLRSAALVTGTASLVQPFDVLAMDEAAEKKIQQSASEHARPTTHPADIHKLARWKPARTGKFDLTSKFDNHFAFAKAQCNLAGAYSWLANYGWIILAPPGKPAFPILGRILLGQFFATPADPKLVDTPSEHDYMLWGTFSTVYVDPRSFEPVSRILNPYTGKMIDVPHLEYADKLAFRLGRSIVVPGVDPKFYDQPWDRDGGYTQHFIDGGQDISYTVLGASQQDGPHQPRCDVSLWTVKRADLMNPAKRSIDTRRSYSATFKVSEYAWYGVEKGDPAQLMVHMDGIKTQNAANLPNIVKRLVLDKSKGRFVL
jgi:hypothetical protein